MKLATSNHHMSDHCSKGIQDHGAKGQGHVAMTTETLRTRELVKR